MVEVPNPFQENFDQWFKIQKPINDQFEAIFHSALQQLREGKISQAQFYQTLISEPTKASIFLRCLKGPFKGEMKLALDRTEDGKLLLHGNDGQFGVLNLNDRSKLAVEQISIIEDPEADAPVRRQPSVDVFQINGVTGIVNTIAAIEDIFLTSVLHAIPQEEPEVQD